MHLPRCIVLGGGALLFLLSGCPALPDNVAIYPPERSPSRKAGGAVFSTEVGLNDAVWLDIPRTDGMGTVGGYLSNNSTTNGGLIILLRGASTLNPNGSMDESRLFLMNFGFPYREAGYLTFSLDYQECGSAYGQGDVADLVTVIDWLENGGKTILGVDRVYTIGYSAGATAAILANRQRRIAATAAIAGITEPTQMQQRWGLYAFAASLFPQNEGLCQVASTLAAYGPPGSPGWDALNTVGHIDELLNPMIVVQGTRDQLFSINNARDLDAAYQRSLSLNPSLTTLEFMYMEGLDHFEPISSREVTDAILAFFERFHGTTSTDVNPPAPVGENANKHIQQLTPNAP